MMTAIIKILFYLVVQSKCQGQVLDQDSQYLDHALPQSRPVLSQRLYEEAADQDQDPRLVMLQTNTRMAKIVSNKTLLDGACPTTLNGLDEKYNVIFGPGGNRNAASFLWFSFIANCAKETGKAVFELLNKGFCPVSGSPIGGENSAKVTLGKVGGGTRTGLFHFCCDPCICDMTDLVKVDTKTIDFGSEKATYNVLVHGNPCESAETRAKLEVPFTDPFDKKSTTLKDQAPNVNCVGNVLEKATLSDGNYPIIGMLFDGSSASIDGTSQESIDGCKQRAKQGYNSGMGTIFRKVAGNTPIA